MPTHVQVYTSVAVVDWRNVDGSVILKSIGDALSESFNVLYKRFGHTSYFVSSMGNSCKNRGQFFRLYFTQASNDSPIFQILLDNTPMQAKKSLEGLAQLLPILRSISIM